MTDLSILEDRIADETGLSKGDIESMGIRGLSPYHLPNGPHRLAVYTLFKVENPSSIYERMLNHVEV
jgi:hypothetical protein